VATELPDTLTEQTLTVVASDREGGIATARVTVPVRQSLQVRAEVPATLSVGDVVQVPVVARNLGREPRRVQIALSSEVLAIEAQDDVLELEVPAQGAVAARFSVHARRAGEASFEARATSGDFVDVERRSVRVRPRGEPTRRGAFGVAREGRVVETDVTIDESRYEVVRLEVALPNGVPVIHGLDRLEGVADGPGFAASQALSLAAVWRYLERTGQLHDAARASLRVKLDAIAIALVSAQNQDGGFGLRFSRESTASDGYLGVYALEALRELREVGAMVPESSLIAARDHVLRRADAHGFLDVRAMATWRGESAMERRALAAEAAHAVIAIHPRNLEHPVMLAWRVMCTAELESPSLDPRTLAHCTAFLHALDAPAYANLIARAAEKLVELRHLTHFEPQWLDAWAGHVAAVDVALEVLEDVAPERFEALAPEAARFLLSTRRTWGTTHDGRGTAHALRALSRLRPITDGDGVLEVEIDGEVTRRVEVRSDDLWAAALALRAQELELSPGEHRIRVRWSGAQEARVELTHEVWSGQGVRDDAPPLTRRVPEALTIDTPTLVELRLPGTGPRVLRQPLPGGLEVLLEPLRAHAKVAAAWMDDDELVVALHDDAVDLTLALVARVPGRVQLPPAVLEDAMGDVIARSSEQTVELREPVTPE